MSQPETRTVKVSGGSITLAVDVEWLSLTDDDFRFIRSLVDAMNRIEAPESAAPIEADLAPAQDGAPSECATCGVALGSWPAAVEHGRIGCKTFDTGEVPCPDCGRKFVNKAGMGVHRGRAHKLSRSADPAPSPERESLVDRILADEPTDAEITEAMAPAPRAVGRHRFTGHHTIVKHEGRPDWRLQCGCGWVTLPSGNQQEALAAFGAHEQEMTAARQALAADAHAWEPSIPSRAADAPEHVLAEKRRVGHQHVVICACGFVTRPSDYQGTAVELLRVHIDAETETAAA